MDQSVMMKKIMEIQKDETLSDTEKAAKRQQLLAGKWSTAPAADKSDGSQGNGAEAGGSKPSGSGLGDDDTLKCAICHDLCVRPVTAPCQHNFCLKCLQDLLAKAKKKACPSCRHEFGAKFVANPRINTALAAAVRAFKQGDARPGAGKPFQRINNDDRPDEAFTTDRAVRAGRANASSGKIMVNVPNDHFGPIPPEADPRGLGVRVGEHWRDRLDCRQWGAHFPHVAGIAGQSGVGAQSVVLSGGYEDDRDEGEWFLYTGSGGRDLSGNKRTNKSQSFDQTFDSMNKALKLSCQKGLPVRVVRSYKEKRSAYAPGEETPVRYDGVYRIVRCWRRKGAQGFLMCRYLFVRSDNDPAPWSSEDVGDRPIDLEKELPEEALKEIREADKGVVTAMAEAPWWDWDADKQAWGWSRPPPLSQRTPGGGSPSKGGARKRVSEHEKALKEMTCGVCKGVASQPVSTPCGHTFCKPCLDAKYAGQADEVDTGAITGRSMRVRKVHKPCPSCKADICDFLRTAQVNRDMESMIVKLQKEVEAARAEEARQHAEGGGEAAAGAEEEEEEEAADEGEEAAAHSDGEGTVAVPPPAAAAPAAAAAQGEAAPSAREAESAKQSLLTAQLASDFPEFEADLVEALVEQEEGDATAVKIALGRMRNQMRAEERKKAKQAKHEAATQTAASGASAAADGEGKPSANGKRAAEPGEVGEGGDKRIKVTAK